MTTPTDDYYDLIGVDPSAPTDEIRERYRERRSELDALLGYLGDQFQP